MRVYVMTDMEGVCGVQDSENWCEPSGRYYEQGRELLTREVNAAVEGFLEAGATDVLVADGHGYGGILPSLLHGAAALARPRPGDRHGRPAASAVRAGDRAPLRRPASAAGQPERPSPQRRRGAQRGTPVRADPSGPPNRGFDVGMAQQFLNLSDLSNVPPSSCNRDTALCASQLARYASQEDAPSAK